MNYRSPDCHLGRHDRCTEGRPQRPPAGVPVIYDVCACACHKTSATRMEPRTVTYATQ